MNHNMHMSRRVPEDLFTREAHTRARLIIVLVAYMLSIMVIFGLLIYFFHKSVSPPFSFWVSFILFWLIYAVYAIVRYYFGGKWLYEMVQTLPSWKTDYRLRDALKDALLAEGMDRKVRLYTVPHSAINAFSLALPDGSYVLFATQGMADKLPAAELQAVMAHELGHMRSGDTRLNTFFLRLMGRHGLKFDEMGRKHSYAFEASEAPVLMELDTMAIKREMNERPIYGRYGFGRYGRRRVPTSSSKKMSILTLIVICTYLIFLALLGIRLERYRPSGTPFILSIEFLIISIVSLVVLLYLMPIAMERLFRFAVDREREYYADLWAVYLTRDPLSAYNAIKMTSEDVRDVLVLHPSLDPLLFHPVVSYTAYKPIQTQPSVMHRLQRLRNNFPQDLAGD